MAEWTSPDTAARGAKVVWETGSIKVDSSIIVWAVRYCLGRLSYAAADGYELVVRVAHRLDDSAVQCLRRDIRQRLDEGAWLSYEEFGGYPDIRRGWENALAALDQEAAARELGDPR